MIVVVDASAAVKLVLDEDGSATARRIWDSPLPLVAPTILVTEVTAGIEAARRAGRLSPEQGRRAHASWGQLTAEVDLLSVDLALAERASAEAVTGAVRGLDAIYLALARQLAEQTTGGRCSCDGRQRTAAGLAGVSLLPVAVPAAAGGRHLGPTVHHVELWMPDVPAVERSLGWLLERLGWSVFQRWADGVSWRRGSVYLVVESSPDLRPGPYRRDAAGLNHLALHAGSRADVDETAIAAADHGWRLLFADRHPYAGGPDHYAAYLEDSSGLEVELVSATEP